MKHVSIIFILGILLIFGCKDSTIGSKHIVKQYGCDGKIINQWTATGNVSNQKQSDGWFFEDSATQKLVEVTGTLSIEQE